jgi:L-ascorbate metabolism protein UlaG (beta-lactamase superfamily)
VRRLAAFIDACSAGGAVPNSMADSIVRALVSREKVAAGQEDRHMPRFAGRLHTVLATLAALALAATEVMAFERAQTPPKPEMMENCPGLIASKRPRVVPAALRLALGSDQVRITYAGHSTFLIESPQLVRIGTDYNDYVRTPVLPDIVTMNHAHTTHYTDRPDPAIRHVLRGWGSSPDQPARHDVHYKDVRVRNVPTNIRSWMSGGTERHGNSIFIYEMANMCIAHLGHLHHTLNQQQLNEIGRVDIVFVPVDGGATLDMEGMFEVLTALKAPLMIPMHFFSSYTLHRFLDRARTQKWAIETSEIPSTVVSKTTLPGTPKVQVLPGQ